MSKEIYEKLGLFYLGKDLDKETMEASEVLTLLKNKNFTTHASIIGMTGSGKTGLGIGIIEEAAIDNIPSIVIDPKGDMGDLCLADPAFSAEKFEPWVRDEAHAKGEDPKEYARKTADTWRAGLADWGQDSSRVERFAGVTKTIYTPGSSAGVSINILSSMGVPPVEIMEDSDTFSAFLKSTVSSLLSLIGIEADPIDSKEYILLATIIADAWQKGEGISVETIIGKIINPGFSKVGVLPLDSYYPQAERFKLASSFNAVIASPGFGAWLQGESLDIQKLLYDNEGKAKVAIFSIGHLNDDERMFFVTLLLNRYIAWMRHQSGTSTLKTLLYMDEIFGFFPPSKNPPSKEPMLLLLKQARAFGVGVVLSTQNPVDLDYKGLSNIGTWLVGRLQTSQDIDRVIEGLGGKAGSDFDRGEIRKLLANLPKRTFFLKSAHLADIRLFMTRWVMSYLKGPLKKAEISALMKPLKSPSEEVEKVYRQNQQAETRFESINTLDRSIPQYYETDISQNEHYYPTLVARAKVGFYNQSRGINEKQEICLTLRLNHSDIEADWEEAVDEKIDFNRFPKKPGSRAKMGMLPSFVRQDKGLKKTGRSLSDMLYQGRKLELYRVRSPKLESKPFEALGDFKVRFQDLLNEKREEEIEKVKERFGRKEQRVLEQLKRAKERLMKEEVDVSSKTTDTMISAGMAVLGALFGRKSTGRVGTTLSKGSRVLKEKQDVKRAQQRVEEVEQQIEALGYELEEKIDILDEKYRIDHYEIEYFYIRPRRSDIVIDEVALVWRVV